MRDFVTDYRALLHRPARERGTILGLILVLLMIIGAAGALSMWGLTADLGAAGQERLSRQLFACTEQALELGKQYFGVAAQGRWSQLLATNVCGALPCPPFPAAAAAQSGAAVAGYPGGAPFTGTITLGGVGLTYQIGIYNNGESPASPLADRDGQVYVYARCTDPVTRQWHALQTLIAAVSPGNDYAGQAGGGGRGTGNFN